MPNLILYAVPFFFLLIAIELVVDHIRKTHTYHEADAVTSLSLGTLSQITGVFGKLIFIGLYAFVLERFALFELSAQNTWVWIGAFIAYDFFYYWNHRLGHEINVLWAAHVVHHSSEDYNLTTALRQTSSGFLFGWIFYVPIALVGVPLPVFVTVAALNLLYQYWIHTQHIGRLGWFDRWFASPSNHRVHHGQNDYCLDKNYGGVFMIWDRMFGTFVEERAVEKIIYGVRKPLRSWNPLWANVQVYADLFRDARLAGNVGDALRVFVKHPGWRPPRAEQRDPRAPYAIEGFQYFESPLNHASASRLMAALAVFIGASLAFMIGHPQWPVH
ncbi:MAG: sterol desaturase family protein, partial [Betaproteobacteria bacterium]|nr:sterol desaturase family protein [Betaproteobacteria bacterium]